MADVISSLWTVMIKGINAASFKILKVIRIVANNSDDIMLVRIIVDVQTSRIVCIVYLDRICLFLSKIDVPIKALEITIDVPNWVA